MEKHGMTDSPEYTTWKSMKARCLCKTHKEYHRYGGRGISIAPAWTDSFLSFLADVGRKPSTGHSPDRINSDGNYEPGNVKWSTLKEQNRNFSDRNSPLRIRGVRLLRGRYYAYIHVDHFQLSLGGFGDFFEAVCRRKSAENKHWSAA